MQQRYLVSGMTCQHCVLAIHQEVASLTGVEDVSVSLDGHLVVTSSVPTVFTQIEQAVTQAGDYQVLEDK